MGWGFRQSARAGLIWVPIVANGHQGVPANVEAQKAISRTASAGGHILGVSQFEAYGFARGNGPKCPDGYKSVTDINACTSAGEALGATDGTEDAAGGNFHGCVLDTILNTLRFRRWPEENLQIKRQVSEPEALPANFSRVCKKIPHLISNEYVWSPSSNSTAAAHRTKDSKTSKFLSYPSANTDTNDVQDVLGSLDFARNSTVEIVLAVEGIEYDQLLGIDHTHGQRFLEEFENVEKKQGLRRAFEGAIKSALIKALPEGISENDIHLTLSPTSVTVKARIDAAKSGVDGFDIESMISDHALQLNEVTAELVSLVPGIIGRVHVSLVGVTGWGKAHHNEEIEKRNSTKHVEDSPTDQERARASLDDREVKALQNGDLDIQLRDSTLPENRVLSRFTLSFSLAACGVLAATLIVYVTLHVTGRAKVRESAPIAQLNAAQADAAGELEPLASNKTLGQAL